MAKKLASTLVAISVGWMLVGCGSGSSTAAKSNGSGPASGITSSISVDPIDYGAQYLDIWAPLKVAADTYFVEINATTKFTEERAKALTVPFATALATFGDRLLRSSWPDSASSVVTKAAQNYIQQSVVIRGMQYPASVTQAQKDWLALATEGFGYTQTIRALLNLPPVVSAG